MKYQEMKSRCTKVTYNMMGEPVKKEINLGRKRQKRPRQSKQCPTALTSSPPTRVKSTDSMPPSQRFQTVVPSDSIRIIHVLREILFGKVIRDVMESRSSSHSATLPDVLRFFCQTSFGVTTVATKRQNDLFHAVLANQGSSSFLRVMKRLLRIPGIKPFDDKVAAMYYEVWCWLIQNDAIADVGTSGKINVSIVKMLRCFDELSSSNGNHLSPKLLDSIEVAMKPQELDCTCRSNGSTEAVPSDILLDADDVLEKILNVIENFDKCASQLDKELFSEPETTVLINGSTTADIRKLCIREKPMDTNTRLSSVKSLLHDCVALDKVRQGVLQRNEFASILYQWYETQYGILASPTEAVGGLITCFSSNEGAEQINYVSFAGVLYTYLLEEENLAPSPEVLMSYINDLFRGVDKHHIDCINKYVENARFKTSRLKASSYRERVVNSRRTLSRIRPYGDSDFIARWVVAPSSKVEHEPTENFHANRLPMSSANKSCGPAKSTKCKPKTPLHVIEVPSANKSCGPTKSSKCKPKTPLHVIEESSTSIDHLESPFRREPLESPLRQDITDVNEDTKINKEKEDKIGTATGTSVYVRFPGIEPFRAPLNDLNRGSQRNPSISPPDPVVEGKKEEQILQDIPELEDKEEDKEELSKKAQYPEHFFVGKEERIQQRTPFKRLNILKRSSTCQSPITSLGISKVQKCSIISGKRGHTIIVVNSKLARRQDSMLDESTKINTYHAVPKSSQNVTSPSRTPARNSKKAVMSVEANIREKAKTHLNEESCGEDPRRQERHGDHKAKACARESRLQRDTGQQGLLHSRTVTLSEDIDEAKRLRQSELKYVSDVAKRSCRAELEYVSEMKSPQTCLSIICQPYGPERPPDEVSMDDGGVNLDKYLLQSVDQIPRCILTCSSPSLSLQGVMTRQQYFSLCIIFQRMTALTHSYMSGQGGSVHSISLASSDCLSFNNESRHLNLLTCDDQKEDSRLGFHSLKDETAVNNDQGGIYRTTSSVHMSDTSLPIMQNSSISIMRGGDVGGEASVPIMQNSNIIIKGGDVGGNGTMLINTIEAVSGDIEIGSRINSKSHIVENSMKNVRVVTSRVGNVYLVNSSCDWEALFHSAECTILDVASKFLLGNHNVKKLLEQNDEGPSGEWESSKVTSKRYRKGSPDKLNSVGVKSLLLASRGRKHKSALYSSRKITRSTRIGAIQPISYRIRR